ncbi:hypothetical protein C370_07360 [Cryptococcus neoformans A1-35-8]|nr:hypothetical protein C370_07360 [Cryptococcus neoformans var. grubii A1-35-8]
MPETTSTAPSSLDTKESHQITSFPPDSRIVGAFTGQPKHMCYCAMHLSPSTGGESSWKGSLPLTNFKGQTARDLQSNLASAEDDEQLIGSVTESNLEGMGLWPAYRDGFKTATGVETGVLVVGVCQRVSRLPDHEDRQHTCY